MIEYVLHVPIFSAYHLQYISLNLQRHSVSSRRLLSVSVRIIVTPRKEKGLIMSWITHDKMRTLLRKKKKREIIRTHTFNCSIPFLCILLSTILWLVLIWEDGMIFLGWGWCGGQSRRSRFSFWLCQYQSHLASSAILYFSETGTFLTAIFGL